jgi:hypothetical protein
MSALRAGGAAVSDRPTPETDAARHDFFSNFGPIPCSYGDWVPVNVSARLERQRDEWARLCGQYKQERDEAQSDLAELCARYNELLGVKKEPKWYNGREIPADIKEAAK